MPEREAISGETGGYSWILIEHVLHALPLVLIPMLSMKAFTFSNHRKGEFVVQRSSIKIKFPI